MDFQRACGIIGQTIHARYKPFADQCAGLGFVGKVLAQQAHKGGSGTASDLSGSGPALCLEGLALGLERPDGFQEGLPGEKGCGMVGCLPERVKNTPDVVGCLPERVKNTPDIAGCPPERVKHSPDAVGCPPERVKSTPDIVGCPPERAKSTPDAVGCPPERVKHQPDIVGCLSSRVKTHPNHVGCPPQRVNTPSDHVGSAKKPGFRPETREIRSF